MNYKEKYYENAMSILKNYKKQQDIFKVIWNKENYKEAYIFVNDFIKKNNIIVSEEYKKADENMYWLLR